MKFAICLLVVLTSWPARADSGTGPTDTKTQAESIYRQGQAHYRTGDLEKAADEFKRSYELYPVPETLFNLAQTHRLLKHYEKAIYCYRQFLATGHPDNDERQSVLDRITQLQKLVDEQQAVKPAVVTPTAPPAASVLVAPQPATATVIAKREKPLVRKPWFWGVMGATVAVVVTGVVLGVTLSRPSYPSVSIGHVEGP